MNNPRCSDIHFFPDHSVEVDEESHEREGRNKGKAEEKEFLIWHLSTKIWKLHSLPELMVNALLWQEVKHPLTTWKNKTKWEATDILNVSAWQLCYKQTATKNIVERFLADSNIDTLWKYKNFLLEVLSSSRKTSDSLSKWVALHMCCTSSYILLQISPLK